MELKSGTLYMPMIGQTIPVGAYQDLHHDDADRLPAPILAGAGLYGVDLFCCGLFLWRFEEECLVSADWRGREQHSKETAAVLPQYSGEHCGSARESRRQSSRVTPARWWKYEPVRRVAQWALGPLNEIFHSGVAWLSLDCPSNEAHRRAHVPRAQERLARPSSLFLFPTVGRISPPLHRFLVQAPSDRPFIVVALRAQRGTEPLPTPLCLASPSSLISARKGGLIGLPLRASHEHILIVRVTRAQETNGPHFPPLESLTASPHTFLPWLLFLLMAPNPFRIPKPMVF